MVPFARYDRDHTIIESLLLSRACKPPTWQTSPVSSSAKVVTLCTLYNILLTHLFYTRF